jgi:hypothetical protein
MDVHVGAVAERQQAANPGWAWQRDRLFFSGMAVAAAIVIFAGFAPTYYLKAAFDAPELSPLLHTHGLIFTSWIVLFVVQTRLIAGRRTPPAGAFTRRSSGAGCSCWRCSRCGSSSAGRGHGSRLRNG